MRDAILFLGFFTLQRLAELVYSRRNEMRLRAQGAWEAGRGHYPVMVLLHAAWFASLWWLAWDRPLDYGLAAAALALQPLRFWTLASLGGRWTTRVLVLPGAPRVETGPYRVLRHPNYAIVVLELALVPLAFGLYLHAAIFSVLNAGLLAWRIRIEERALAAAAAPAPFAPLANGGQGR
jgi:methyltransferase